MTKPTTPAVRVNLLRAHGSPTGYLHRYHGCRCAPCRGAKAQDNAAYYLAHRDEVNARTTKYGISRRVEHREEAVATTRQWRKDHPGAQRALKHHRRARKLAAPGTHTAADVAAQYKRQKGRCYWCKAKTGISYHIDHVIPLALGGSDGPENIVIACPHCNCSKSAEHPMDFAGVMF